MSLHRYLKQAANQVPIDLLHAVAEVLGTQLTSLWPRACKGLLELPAAPVGIACAAAKQTTILKSAQEVTGATHSEELSCTTPRDAQLRTIQESVKQSHSLCPCCYIVQAMIILVVSLFLQVLYLSHCVVAFSFIKAWKMLRIIAHSTFHNYIWNLGQALLFLSDQSCMTNWHNSEVRLAAELQQRLAAELQQRLAAEL